MPCDVYLYNDAVAVFGWSCTVVATSARRANLGSAQIAVPTPSACHVNLGFSPKSSWYRVTINPASGCGYGPLTTPRFNRSFTGTHHLVLPVLPAVATAGPGSPPGGPFIIRKKLPLEEAIASSAWTNAEKEGVRELAQNYRLGQRMKDKGEEPWAEWLDEWQEMLDRLGIALEIAKPGGGGPEGGPGVFMSELESVVIMGRVGNDEPLAES